MLSESIYLQDMRAVCSRVVSNCSPAVRTAVTETEDEFSTDSVLFRSLPTELPD
jgi:hypothetical protein